MAQNTKPVDTTVQEVDEAISKSEQFIEKNRNNIIYGMLASIVVVLAVWGWNALSENSNNKAQNEIYPSQFLFEQGDFQNAVEGFEAIIDEYGSTKAGNVARLYAGLCYKELGQYDKAINYLNDFSASDAVMAPSALIALGNCYVDQENPDYKKAAATFEKAASAANNAVYSPLALKKAGLAYEAAGDNASALKAYEQIKNNWAETATAATIDKYIARVK